MSLLGFFDDYVVVRKFREVKVHRVLSTQYNVFQDYVSDLILLFDSSAQRFSNVKDLLDYYEDKEALTRFRSLTSCDIVKELSVNCNSPLHIACKVGDLNYVRNSICSPYVDFANKDGDTPLHIACRLGHEEICEYITKLVIGYASDNCVRLHYHWLHVISGQYLKGPSPESIINSESNTLVSIDLPSILAKNKENNTPFQEALKNGQYFCMRIIAKCSEVHFILSLKSMTLISLDYDNLSGIAGSTEGYTVMLSGALYHKYMKECIEIVHNYRQSNYTKIVAHVAFFRQLMNDTGQYPIETLINNSDTSVSITDIIKLYPHIWYDTIKHDYSTFCDICRRFELPEVDKEMWKDMCQEQDKDDTLLRYICRNGSVENATQLFSHCDINKRNEYGDTPLWVAFRKSDYSICSGLVLNEQCDIYNYNKKFNADITILCKKISVPEFEVTEIIPGDTLLHAAATSGASRAISFLVRWINLNKLNSKQQYPLHVACKSGLSIEAIHLLRECDITHKDIDGNTPLDLLYKHHPNRHDLMACAMGSSYYIPGVTPSPCSREELVSTEWFCDLDFRELKKHHTQQNNALHMAVEIGSTILIEELKESYLVLFNQFKSEKNVFSTMPLHIAAAQRNLRCLQLVSEGCDINAVNTYGETCLHLACKNANNFSNDLEIVKFVYEILNCNANICDKRGRSALHMACITGNVPIVRYILKNMNIHPNLQDNQKCTPLMLTSLDHHDIIKLLIEHGADTSYLYDTYKEFFKRYQSETPPPTPLNIIVAGKPSSGKSTLIKALCSDGSQTIVEAEPHTAGIIPSSHHSDQLGCVSFYDLAGQSEYYASHEAVLHTVMASSTPLILLLIDSRKDQGLIQQDILYWLHFFTCQLPTTSSKTEPHIILIFSFADQIPDQLAKKKIHCSKNFITSLFAKTKFCLSSISFLDCRVPNSKDIKLLRSTVNTCASVLCDSAPIDFLLHCFYAFLLHSFKLQPAIRICDVLNAKEEWILSGIDPNITSASDSESSLSSYEEFDVENEPTFEEENPANLLPNNTTDFLKLSEELHKKGHIIFIKNHHNANKSWLVINKEILLHEINGSLFAPNVQSCCEITSTSTGVVPASAIANHFDGKYNIDMLIGILLHLEYCQILTDKCVLELLSSESILKSDEFYFFPGLVTTKKPENAWSPQIESVVQCCWILCVADVQSFYTPRFIQVLLLRVAFQNAFPVNNLRRDFKCPSICCSCSVWKNGIFWRNELGTECILEVIEESQAIIFMMRFLETDLQGNSLKEFLFVRSSLIETVLKCVEDICQSLNVVEYFVHPDQIQYPPIPCKDMALFNVKNIARAICQRCEIVMCDNPKCNHLELSKLLHFEPFIHFCLKNLFNEPNQNEILAEDDIQAISEFVCSDNIYLKLLCGDDVKEQMSFTTIDIEAVMSIWKNQTYHDFRCCLSKFSIFGRRDLQVLGNCAIKDYSLERHPEMVKTPISDLKKNDYSAIIKENYPKLLEKLQCSIKSVAHHSYTKNLISQQTYSEIMGLNTTQCEKTRKLLINVEHNIALKEEAFDQFCEVLEACEFDDIVISLKQDHRI